MTMTSRRPYMIRAFYEWIVDNNCTPYLLVNAHASGVEVPQEHVNKDGQIILNIAPASVVDLDMLDDSISFSARFGGVPRRLFIPSYAVQGIYARENGQGMVFEAEAEPPQPLPPSGGDDSESKRPSLRVVK
ncbi:ClpXP protease specificity-enhancing factor [Gilvimarinus polysaccharolyticus]|uniref:ClpXP protease specificity-enhancing factor n=1 Tax=Gilvimarinus polysaccharolyticus TaxID=863921 RepID=UPI0006733783|nr:ClpXP protease specificity-enhancing factor [Gilvimarinus polysaccharolyticus]